jgi:Zn-dependent protease
MSLSDWLLRGLMNLIPLWLSLSVHEWAHAWSAYRLGDDTAARQDRLTLNPLVHADPIGTFVAPLLGIPFGWARPVPISPARFRRDITMRTGVLLTAAAGPVSNLLLAIACAVAYGLLLRHGLLVEGSGLDRLVLAGINCNVALFVFNFFPVPPLDGSRVVDGLIPYRLRRQWDELTRYSWIALLVVILAGGTLLAAPIGWIDAHLRDLIRSVAGR